MQLIIQGRHITVTPAINTYVKNKIKKTTDHFDGIIHAHVVIEATKGTHTAEVTITSGHHHFHNKINTDDLYKSIDYLFDKIERQVRRYKEYRNDKKKKQERLSVHLEEVSEVRDNTEVIIDDVEISDKPMNDLEAALQLSVEKDQFVIGYFTHFDQEHPSYLEKVSDKEYNLLAYEDFWELRVVELVDENKLEIKEVKSIKPPVDSLEHAIDYLNHTNEKYRFFISVRTEKSMFLHKINENHFSLVREQL